MLGFSILVLAVYIWGIRRIKYYRKTHKGRELFLNLFFLYLLTVFFLVFYPFEFKYPVFDPSSWNLMPFVETIYQLKRKVNGVPVYGLLYLVGNIALFIPLGFFLPLLYKKFARFLRISTFGLFLSLSIEWVQTTFSNRYFDIDDVVYNTLGTITGFIFYLCAALICRNISFLKSEFLKIQKK
jgi:glycopeptide antibiotics resistance protein